MPNLSSILPEGDQFRVRVRFAGRDFDGGLWPTRLDAIAARNRLVGRLLRGEVTGG